MSDLPKILGQAALAATTLTDVYAVPAGIQAVISTITVCNRGATPTTFRIALAPAGAADNVKHYHIFDLSLPGNDSWKETIGVTLSGTDVVRAFAGNGNLSVNVLGVEIYP